jgi:hypothetical protein
MITRNLGKIKPLKMQTIPKAFLSFDVETYVIAVEEYKVEFPFRLGVLIYDKLDSNGQITKREVHHCNTIDDLVETMLSYASFRYTLYIFGHNVSFDIRVCNLFRVFHDLGFKSDLPILNNRLFIWDVYTTKGKITFVDTANYAVTSVKQLGSDLGLPKLAVDFNEDDSETVFLYCERDCNIVEIFMLKFIQFIHDNGLGRFRHSLASQALTTYRTKFMSVDIHNHDEPDILKLERDSYHGGRVECYRVGLQTSKHTYYSVDVNSMYPACMYEFRQPKRYVAKDNDITSSTLAHYRKMYYCIADVYIETSRNIYAKMVNGKLIFPIGRFRTTLHDCELAEALSHNEVKHVYSVAMYQQSKLFTDYIDFFYKGKLDAEKAGQKEYRFIYKLFMNNLYGKFGQSGTTRTFIGNAEEEDIIRVTGIDTVTHEKYQEFLWFDKAYRETRGGESFYSFPAISGAITAQARLKLYRFIQIADPSNCFYCDTDSIVVNAKGLANLKEWIDPTKLGYLKLEKQSTHLLIRNNKDYEFGEYAKTKGIPLQASILINRDTYRYRQFEGLLTWYNTGAKSIPSASWRIKMRKGSYDKGQVTNGIVTPFILDETI